MCFSCANLRDHAISNLITYVDGRPHNYMVIHMRTFQRFLIRVTYTETLLHGASVHLFCHHCLSSSCSHIQLVECREHIKRSFAPVVYQEFKEEEEQEEIEEEDCDWLIQAKRRNKQIKKQTQDRALTQDLESFLL